MKQITTLLLFCLLFSSPGFAASAANIAETTIPESSAIQEPNAISGAVPTSEPNTVPTAVPTSEPNLVPSVIVTPEAPPATLSAASGSPAMNQALLQGNSISDYRLSPGDSLEISVWKEEGLQQQQYLVSPDGSLIFPLVGAITVAGKTITEVKDILTSRLADYISDPSVTVKLLNNLGNTVFVIGKVTKPGQYYSGRKIDVLQALSLAGGITVYANENSISVLRRVGNEIKVFPFEYSNVINGEDLEQNILLEPGDTVTVP